MNNLEIPELVSALVQAWNAHDPDRVAGFHAPEYEGRDIAQVRPEIGPEGARQAFCRFLKAFPDLELIPDDLLTQGDRAVLLWRLCGTHRGPLLRIPPSGRWIEFTGVSMFEIRGNRVVRRFTLWDLAGVLREIGLLPAPPEE
jgi:steroid delta-isomerase-like uncharacterized protein